MYRKLRGRIVEKFGTSKAFAEEIGMTPTALSLKLTGKTEFDAPTMRKWCEVLDIPFEEAGLYFLPHNLNSV